MNYAKSMKIVALILASLTTVGCAEKNSSAYENKGKEIYIPRDLQGMDLNDPESEWSYHRMDTTENLAIFWQKGFGNDLSCPPQLEGTDMSIDLENLKEKLETFYAYYRDTLKFVKPGSKSEKYRMMVMLNYSLEGTAYGGDYDEEIGALWLAPNRVKDKALNCIAHELGHSFQSQITCDGEGICWGGCGFYEMTAQYMLWQVNPHWMDDENYHWKDYCRQTHKAFLHIANIYHTCHIEEYWAMLHGKPFIAELFREGVRGEDPVMTYKRLNDMTQEEFCDEMFHAACMTVNLDYPRVWDITRQHALQITSKMDTLAGGWLSPTKDNIPENYGYNVIEVPMPKSGNVTADFEALDPVDVTRDQVRARGFRYGFVAVDAEGKTHYGKTYSALRGRAEFSLPSHLSLLTSHLYLVVMGAPTFHWINPEGGKDTPSGDPLIPSLLSDVWNNPKPSTDAKWNYRVRL